MGTSDVLDFESFQLKDWWDRIRHNEDNSLVQLSLGAWDPLSAKLFGGSLGQDWEPFVNAWGGPMGGGTMGTDKGGGIYERAEAAGVNTRTSGASHSIAEMIAQYYAGNAGFEALGNLTGADPQNLQQGFNVGRNLTSAESPEGDASLGGIGGIGAGGNKGGQSGQNEAEQAVKKQQAEELLRQALRLEEERRQRELLAKMQQQSEVRYFA